jgi:hypothetical protein
LIAEKTWRARRVPVDAAFNSNNRPIAYFYNNGGEAMGVRTNWTEMDDWGAGGSSRASQTQVRSDAFEGTASSSTGTNRNWFMIMAEIKAATPAALPAPVLVRQAVNRAATY